jgi:Phage tail tube protein, GTA-gp10
MARDLTWAGGEHAFDLKIAHLRALQDKCDAGPQWILQRLMSKQWRVDDVIQPIRLGLEGGGMDKETARKLVKQHVEDQPLTLSVLTAQTVLMLALFGPEDDPVGERQAGAGNATQTRSPAESGGSPTSTNGPASSTATSAG